MASENKLIDTSQSKLYQIINSVGLQVFGIYVSRCNFLWDHSTLSTKHFRCFRIVWEAPELVNVGNLSRWTDL